MERLVTNYFCPTVLDFEASGFASDSYPIEVGVVTYEGERYCSLIEPQTHWHHWDKSAEQLHGISRVQLHNAGRSVRSVCEQLNDLLAGHQVYSDAWVWDQRWLITLYDAARMQPSYTFSPIESIVTEQQLQKWDKEKQHVFKSVGGARHRASTDAYVIQQTYLNTRSDGVLVSAAPKLVPRVGAGRA
ncbi:hypothetical protein KO528_08530 [Saccharophagus degradans]|nr:hypothetical protein [Saccharophagus degradans]